MFFSNNRKSEQSLISGPDKTAATQNYTANSIILRFLSSACSANGTAGIEDPIN